MFSFLPPEAGVFLALVLIVIFIRMLFQGKGSNSTSRGVKIQFDTPFLELDVQPVSEGDTIHYAFELEGKYTACIENKKKHTKLHLEAATKKELEKKIEDAFRAWAVKGRKEPKSKIPILKVKKKQDSEATFIKI